jgi:hypothetical protein
MRNHFPTDHLIEKGELIEIKEEIQQKIQSQNQPEYAKYHSQNPYFLISSKK